jgi:hypothetical protein
MLIPGDEALIRFAGLFETPVDRTLATHEAVSRKRICATLRIAVPIKKARFVVEV